MACLPDDRGQHAIAAVELVAQALQHVHFVVNDQESMPPLLHPACSGRLGHIWLISRSERSVVASTVAHGFV